MSLCKQSYYIVDCSKKEMHFCIRACDVSALAGRNVFRSQKVALKRLVKSKVSVDDKECSGENKKVVALLRRGPMYQQAVGCGVLSRETCLRAEEECKHILHKHYGDSKQVTGLVRRYQHLYLKDRGLMVEQVVLHKLKDSGYNVTPKPKKERTFSKTFKTLSGENTYTLYGCVDGIQEDSSGSISLVEVKSRKSQSLTYLHEVDQVVVYLVLSGFPQARIVEYVNGKVLLSRTVTLSEAQKVWDTELRGPLENSLSEAVQNIVDLLP